jgi:hypothetical protein
MGLFDSFVDALADAGEAVIDAGAVVVDTGADVVGAVGEATGEVLDTAITVADIATAGVVGDALAVVDDVVLDTVDTATGGIVDIDLDDGTISASVGIDGIADVSASVGRDGISSDAVAVNQAVGASVGKDGVGTTIDAGINYGYLPYVHTDLEVQPDGDLRLDTEVQGTLPTPYGLVSGEVVTDIARTEDSFAVTYDAEGQLLTSSGVTIGGDVLVDYEHTPDGSNLALGLGGFVSKPGMGRAEAEVGYQRTEMDGVVVEAYHAAAAAEGYGVTAGAGVDHVVATAASGETVSVTQTATEIDVDLGLAFGAAESTESGVGDLFADL